MLPITAISLLMLIATLLGTKRPTPLRLLGNTSMASVVFDDGAASVRRGILPGLIGAAVAQRVSHPHGDVDVGSPTRLAAGRRQLLTARRQDLLDYLSLRVGEGARPRTTAR